jgi:hypothetical protein
MAEAIRIVGVWMAFVQSLYDAVSLCAHNPNINSNVAVIDVGNAVYISPVEDAAAFWYGSRGGDGNGNVGGEDDNNGSCTHGRGRRVQTLTGWTSSQMTRLGVD